VLADAGYGNDSAWRAGLGELGLTYAVGIQGSTTVWCQSARKRDPYRHPKRTPFVAVCAGSP
jgi:SRSO17 transposase